MNQFLEKFNNRVKQIDNQSILDVPTVPKPRYDTVIEERWTVYLFSVPVKFSKKIAWGFESKDVAKKFIRTHLKDKIIELEGITYFVRYDTILESKEEVNVYYNDPEVTIYGNDKEYILDRWVG